jgi:F0F1-type ATP synthase membrane subunit c/vacuolar-type H+-ATPase subunit K
MALSRRFPRWLAWLGLLGGLGTVAAGIAQAYTGFSGLAMMLSMPSGSILLLWAVLTGAYLWRLAPSSL